MVRSPRIELGTPAWKAGVLPLNYDRSPANGDASAGRRHRQASNGARPRKNGFADAGPRNHLSPDHREPHPVPRALLEPGTLPALRPERRQAAASLARAVAQFRRRRQLREQPGAGPEGLRPGHHPLRPREQLRPASRVRRVDVRPDRPRGPGRAPRRAHRLDQGGLRHVGGALRGLGLAQVPAREPRPEPEAPRARLRRHLLQPQARPRDARGGDHGGARARGPLRQGALHGALELRSRADRARVEAPAGDGDPVPHPPAAGTTCSTGRPSAASSTRSRARGSGASPSARSLRACSPAGTWPGSPPTPAPGTTPGSSSPSRSRRTSGRGCAGWTRSRKARGQSLAQLALAWVLRQPAITSALIGASKTSQIDENLGALKGLDISADELRTIDGIVS